MIMLDLLLQEYPGYTASALLQEDALLVRYLWEIANARREARSEKR